MDSNRVAARVESFFNELERDVFVGDPVANSSLHVEVVTAQPIAGGAVITVIAPWTIAGLLFIDDDRFPSTLDIAGRRLRVLGNEVPSLGRYRSVTLVSDVGTLATQDEARAALAAVKEPFLAAVVGARESATVENPARRALFRTLTTGTEPTG